MKLLLSIIIIAANLLLSSVSIAEEVDEEYCSSLRKISVTIATNMRKGVPLESMIAWGTSQETRIEKFLVDPQAVLRPMIYYVYGFQYDKTVSPIEIGNLVIGQCRNGGYGNVAPRAVRHPGFKAKPGKRKRIVDSGSYSIGTGWPIAEGLIVTNYHVVKGRNELSLLLSDNRRVQASIMIVDTENDLALLKVDEPNVLPPALRIAEKPASLGAKVFTIGYPHPDIMGSQPKLTNGIISSLSGLHDDKRTYQITVALQSGNSGGPLINMQGQVVGIVTSKLSAMSVFRWTGDLPQNVNYAMKSGLLLDLLESLGEQDMVLDEVEPVGENLQQLAAAIKDSVLIVIAQ